MICNTLIQDSSDCIIWIEYEALAKPLHLALAKVILSGFIDLYQYIYQQELREAVFTAVLTEKLNCLCKNKCVIKNEQFR